jgi:hypothetical protein
MHLLAVGTLEIGVFNHRNRRTRPAANMVARSHSRRVQTAELQVLPKGWVSVIEKKKYIQHQTARRKHGEKAEEEIPAMVPNDFQFLPRTARIRRNERG